MRQVSLRALRAHWPSAAGVFLTMLLAAALVSAAGTLIESGLRDDDPFSPAATILPSMMTSFGGVAVMIAVFVVSTAFAAALRDRQREFALLRAVGTSGRQIRGLVTTEVMLISGAGVAAGSAVGFAGAKAIVPLLRTSGIVDDQFTPVLSAWPLLGAAVLLLPAAWIAGLLAAREMARLSPTAAVSTSTVDTKPLGKGRITAAWICAAGGALATLSPVFIPGTMGGATGAASALLFITAVALAGPALVLRGATWASQRKILRSRAPSLLATVNARGYSRRLTAAVVPLALLVSLGTIQTGMNTVVTNAAKQQIAAAHAGDFIWEGDGTGLGDVQAALGSLPGVVATAATEVSVVHARVEDPSPIDRTGLTWEPSSLRVIDAEPGLIDADVTDGDLAALTGRDTIAVASDTLAFTFKGVGDTIGVRYPDGTETDPMIVAVYERGLGLGGLIASAEGFESAAMPDASPTVVIQTAEGEQSAVQQAARESGFDLVTPQEYADAAADSGGDNQLGDTMLLALLGFIGIAAGNALVIATRARSNEFALLGRIGATKRQMWSMLAIEGALVAVGAVVIGTLIALPGLIAAALALVSGFSGVLDLTVYGGLVLAATVIAFAGMAGARLKVKV